LEWYRPRGGDDCSRGSFCPKPVYLFLLIALLVSFVLALTTMTGDNVKAIKGAQNVIYPIYLDNDEDVVGFQVIVNYSTSYLTLQDIEATTRLSDATIIYKDQSPVIKIVVLVNNESEKISPGNDAVLNLIFNVDSNALTGNYTVDLSDLVSANISAIVLNSSESDGIFEIVEPYGFEFLPPVSNFDDFTLQQGATLPLKFNVTDTNNNFVSDDSVLVRVYNLSLGIDKTYNASGTGNDYIDIQENQYLINIHTGELNMSEGIYDIDVTFDNYQIELIGFELLDKSQGIGKGRQR